MLKYFSQKLLFRKTLSAWENNYVCNVCVGVTAVCKTLSVVNVLSKQREIQFFTSNLFDAQNHIAKCIR